MMSMTTRMRPFVIAVAVFLLLASPSASQPTATPWVGAWATAPVELPLPTPDAAASAQGAAAFGAPLVVNSQTLRQIVRVTAGGTSVRVAVTNRYGTSPLHIGAAHVAHRADGAGVTPGSGGALTFRHQPFVTVAPGAVVLSDPVEMTVEPLDELAIDLFLPGDFQRTTSPATTHALGLVTNYLSATGDHVGVVSLPVESTFTAWFYLARVDVAAPTGTPVIVAMGDSITDGVGATPDAHRRWPDILANRLVEAYGDAAPAVLNVGISGNRVLSHNAGLAILQGGAGADAPPPNPNAMFGPSGLSRFDRDVLLQPGVTHVVVLESINDIGMAFAAESPTVADVIAGHRALIQRAHVRGVTIIGATLTPFEGAFYFTEAGEAKRQALNDWIRTGSAYDAVVDFDAAVRDPSNPRRFHPDYHSGDWLHGSDAGYRAMAEAIDLTWFTSDRMASRAEPAAAASTAP